MEEPQRPNSAPQKKQVFVNIGRVFTHGGGGIGGFILLGGALSTAAFASAFVIGKKWRCHRNSSIPPPPPPPVDKKDERDTEANIEQQFTFLDVDKHSSETTIEIELKNDSQSLLLDEKHRIEIDGVVACDSQESEQTLCSITPTIPENSAICGGDVSLSPAQEQEKLLPLEIENMMVHNVKIQPQRDATIDENAITKECQGFEKVKGESRDDRATELMGENHEMECEDMEESKGNCVPEIGLKFSKEGNFVSELQGKDGQESINGDEKQGFLSDEVGQIIHEYEAIEGAEKDQVEHIEDHLVKDHKECDEIDEEIIMRKDEEEKNDPRSEGNDEEKGQIDDPGPENRQLGDSEEDVQIFEMHLPEEELIFPEEMGVSEEDIVSEDIEVSFFQHNDTEDEVEKIIENEVDEGSSETIDTGNATAKDEEDIIDDTDSDEDLSDEAEQNTEGSMESDLAGIWPAETIQEPLIETELKLVSQEIEGKTQEDTTVKHGKHELQPHKIIADKTQISNDKCNSAKTFIERYVMQPATLKDYSRNPGTRKVLVVAIPVLSSVSCSWFFGLSFDKFCLVVLLTIILSKSMIVKYSA